MSLMTDSASPLYQQIKAHILDKITSGVWGATERIPSENELIRTLGVSRMTVNRALRELAEEGYLVRVVGVGTFVAESKVQVHPLTIRNIADEIRERGHEHSADVVLAAREQATAKVAAQMEIKRASRIFHTLIVHKENGTPIQVEDRYVNPAIAHDYLKCDFTRTTPYEHLMAVAPHPEVEHVVEAQMPTTKIARLLELPSGEPCLLITRKTWARGQVASFARLYHPSSTYKLVGRFGPVGTARPGAPTHPF